MSRPSGTPIFDNAAGAVELHIQVREFRCMGAPPPHDHPHIYLDMGTNTEIRCPYCSTLYRYDPEPAGDISATQYSPPDPAQESSA